MQFHITIYKRIKCTWNACIEHSSYMRRTLLPNAHSIYFASCWNAIKQSCIFYHLHWLDGRVSWRDRAVRLGKPPSAASISRRQHRHRRRRLCSDRPPRSSRPWRQHRPTSPWSTSPSSWRSSTRSSSRRRRQATRSSDDDDVEATSTTSCAVTPLPRSTTGARLMSVVKATRTGQSLDGTSVKL